MVNGLAFRIMGRDSDVDDLVQDSFVQALSGLEALKDPQAFAAWLGSIVVRTASKLLRRRRLLTRLGLRRVGEPVDVDALVGRLAPPDVATELRSIYAVVDALKVEERVPLLLRRVEGLGLEEIAATMGVSLATAKRRLAAAEQALARKLTNGEGR